LLDAAARTIPEDEDWVRVDEALLRQTLNHQLLDRGLAYYTVYTSTPASHRAELRRAAAAARDARRGIWAQDATSDFQLQDQDSIGPGGQLILPKLFRRCTDYLKAVADGFRGNLGDWLVWVSESRTRNENDRVVIRDSMETHLSELLDQRNDRIAFQADVLDITFVEK
ncbi:MAG: thermonuclease family protein, partial [Chloroflexota bacterium]